LTGFGKLVELYRTNKDDFGDVTEARQADGQPD